MYDDLLEILDDILVKLEVLTIKMTTVESSLSRLKQLEEKQNLLSDKLRTLDNETSAFRVLLGSNEVGPWFIKVERELSSMKAVLNKKLGITDEERYASYDQ